MSRRDAKSAVSDDPSSDTLSLEEIRAAIDGFSDVDWLRIKKAALHFSFPGRCHHEWEDLRNEALVRSLDGRRKCPRGVSVPTFIGNVMRSLTPEVDPIDDHVLRSDDVEFQQEEPSGVTSLAETPDSLTSNLDAKRMITTAIGLFEGETIAQMLFAGNVDGMEGQELRDCLELSQTEFDSKRKFVRRRLNAHFERRTP